MLGLPRDLAAHVLRFLSLVDVALVYALVSREARAVAQFALESTAAVRVSDAGTYPSGFAARHQTDDWRVLLGVLGRHCPRLRTADLRFADGVPLALLAPALDASRRTLTTLFVSHVTSRRPFRTTFPRLRVLCIAANVESRMLEALRAFHTLEALELGASSHFPTYDMSELAAVLNGNPGLKILSLIGHTSLAILERCALPRVRALAFPYMKIRPSPDAIARFQQWPALESLNLGESRLEPSDVRAFARVCPRLTRFSFTLVDAEMLEIIEDLCNPAFLPQLTLLGCRTGYGERVVESFYTRALRVHRPGLAVYDYACFRCAPRWCVKPFDLATLAAELLD